MKLLTLADGFGDSVAVPTWYPKYFKWPKIIEFMTKDLDLLDYCKYGAGNEFIVNQLKHNITTADMVLVQWTVPNRLDLVLAHDHNFWNDVISKDPVYSDNIVECGGNKFWLSSASTADPIAIYHQQYISTKQHQMRSQIYIDYAKMLLNEHKIPYRFMLTSDANYLDVNANWVWHESGKGMCSFRNTSQYRELDFNIAQPIPLIMFDFIKQYIMPSIDLNWRKTVELDAVENMLYRHYRESVKNKPYDSN